MRNSRLLPVMEDRRDNGKHALIALLPYWPVISFCIVMIFTAGGIFIKLDFIQKAVEKTDQQFGIVGQQIATQNDRINNISNSMTEIRGVNSQQNSDLNRLEKQVSVLQTNVEHLQRGRVWAPK